MSWNYRVLRRADKNGNTYLTIGEVYYKENGDIDRWTEHDFLRVDESEGADGLEKALYRMLNMMLTDKSVVDLVEVESVNPKSIFGKASTLENALKEGAVYPTRPERILEEEFWRDQTSDYNASLT